MNIDMPRRDPESGPVFRAVMMALPFGFGYVIGVAREHDRIVTMATCPTPATQLSSVLVYRDSSGNIRCQRRGPAYLEQ